MARHSILKDYSSTKTIMRQLENIASSSDGSAAWSFIDKLIATLGFDYGGVGVLDVSGTELDISLPHSTPFFGKSFQDYFENGLHVTDPAGHALANGKSDVLASHAFRKAPAPLRDGAQLMIQHFQRDSIVDHWTLRVDLGSQSQAGFLAVGSRGSTTMSEFQNLVAQHAGTLRLAASVYAGKRLFQSGRGASFQILSAREKRVLTLLSQGLSPQEIAEEEGRALATVRRQIATARRQLGARSTAHAVAIALESGAILRA